MTKAVYNNSSLSFWTCRYDNRLDRNDWEVINLLLVLPILFYLNIPNTDKILRFSNKNIGRRAWHVIPAQDVSRRTKKVFVFLKDETCIQIKRSKFVMFTRLNVINVTNVGEKRRELSSLEDSTFIELRPCYSWTSSWKISPPYGRANIKVNI